MLNKELQDSLKVKAEYDKLNARTVERVKTYDPRLKIWTFERLHTDPDAHKMNIKPARQPEKVRKADKKNVIIRLLREKKTLKFIATKLDMSYNAVQYASRKLYKRYPELKKRKSTKESKEKLLQMRKDGKSQKEMSAVTGLAISTIKEYLRQSK